MSACQSDDGEADIQCNDPAAVTFDPDAVSNVACAYEAVLNFPVEIAILPKALQEISGIEKFADGLIGHNDQNNEPRIFIFSAQSGQITHTFDVLDAPNNDWEDMAVSSDHLFLGDMGNNDGDRQDLGIFRIPLSEVLPGQVTQVSSDAHIRFRYPQQQQFNVEDHNFDCEALLHFDGHLYLFTKNRGDRRTNLYRIPDTPGVVHDAVFLGGFEATGRISGATISPDGHTVALVGYRRSGNSFVWKLNDFADPRNFLSGSKLQYVLGPYTLVGQLEGVAFKSSSELILASEKESTLDLPGKLYLLENF